MCIVFNNCPCVQHTYAQDLSNIVWASVCACLRVVVYIDMHACKYALYIYTCTHTSHTCIRACTNTYTHACMHTYIHTYTARSAAHSNSTRLGPRTRLSPISEYHVFVCMYVHSYVCAYWARARGFPPSVELRVQIRVCTYLCM